MTTSTFEIRKFIGGLSLFLYGIFLFQYSIKKLGSRYLKKILRERTNTTFKGILSGTFSTAVLQSSSVVTLMILGFVGAGILAFDHSIGVIVGTNIGATITAWIIGVFGFSLNLESVALPVIGITGLSMFLLPKNKKIYFISLFLFGFGLLLFGLNFMKGSFAFGPEFSLESYVSIPLILFTLIGVVITGLVQSTAVCNTIVFTALYSGIINFEMAAMIIIGSNIGTTITAILGSIGGNTNQKQVAAVHLVYNITTAAIILILFRPIINLIQNVIKIDGVIGLAAFHTLFNLIGALSFSPFIKYISKLIKKIIPDKQANFHLTVMDIPEESGSTAIFAIQKDIEDMTNNVIRSNLSIFNINTKYIKDKELELTESLKEKYEITERTFEQNYNYIKKSESYLLNFCLQFEYSEGTAEDIEKIQNLDKSIIEISQSAKMIKDIKHNVEDIKFSDKKIIKEQFDYFRKVILEKFHNLYSLITEEDTEKSIKGIKKIRKQIKDEEKEYLKNINKTFKENSVWGNIKSLFFSKQLEQEEFENIIRTHSYILSSYNILIKGIEKRKESFR